MEYLFNIKLWIIAAFVAYYVKGLCGFANTLVFTSIMGYGADNINISPIDLTLSYPSNIILALKNRKKLNPKIYIPLSVMVLSGSIPGALLLKNVEARFLMAFFGIVVTLIGADMLFRGKKESKRNNSKLVLGIVGIISGILCGIFGVGALLATYVGRVTESSDEFKANISAVFIAENTFRVILYSVVGVLNWEVLKQSFILLPFMLLGLLAGIVSGKVIDDKIVKKLVIILLIISGLVLFFKNIII